MSHFINGRCSQCGECCGHLLPLSRADIKQLKRYIRKHKKVLYTPREQAVLISELLISCPFLLLDKKEERCSVYPARPAVCRLFDCQEHTYGTLPGKIDRYKVWNMFDLVDSLLKDEL